MCLLTAFCVLVISDLLTNIPKRTNLDLAKWENGQRTFDLSFRRIHSLLNHQMLGSTGILFVSPGKQIAP